MLRAAVVAVAQIPTEFDFVREAEMMTLVRQNLRKAGITKVVIPRAIPGLVSRRSLCMTFVDGCRVDNAVALKHWGIRPKRLVQALGEAYGKYGVVLLGHVVAVKWDVKRPLSHMDARLWHADGVDLRENGILLMVKPGVLLGQMLLVDGLAHCDRTYGNIPPERLFTREVLVKCYVSLVADGPFGQMRERLRPNCDDTLGSCYAAKQRTWETVCAFTSRACPCAICCELCDDSNFSFFVVCGLYRCTVIVQRDGRVALIDFGQTKEIPADLRKRLCWFYLALCSGHKLYILKTFSELGIELDIDVNNLDEKIIDMVPVYANGMLDTAPLPADVEINPFSRDSPLNEVGIKRFNPDLFMVLRTMGLLRSLCDTLDVDIALSQVFRPFARRGLSRRVPSDMEKQRRSEAVRSALTSSVPSPFAVFEEESQTDTCPIL